MASAFQYQLRDSASERSTRRRERLLGRLRNVCTHIIDLDLVQDDDGKLALHIHPAFETHFGTLHYTCMRCGLRVSQYATQVHMRHLERSYQRDPKGTLDRLTEDQTKATKLIEKLNRLGGAP